MPQVEQGHSQRDRGGFGRVRTAGEGPARLRGRPRARATRSAARAASVRKGAGTGARVLAVAALLVGVFAVLSVLTASDSGGGSRERSGTTAAQSDSVRSDETSTAEDRSGETPKAPAQATYKVKPGDSFAAIAEATGVDVDTLAELNPDVDPRALQPGQKLKLK